jgi:hypothetical protein
MSLNLCQIGRKTATTFCWAFLLLHFVGANPATKTTQADEECKPPTEALKTLEQAKRLEV